MPPVRQTFTQPFVSLQRNTAANKSGRSQNYLIFCGFQHAPFVGVAESWTYAFDRLGGPGRLHMMKMLRSTHVELGYIQRIESSLPENGVVDVPR